MMQNAHSIYQVYFGLKCFFSAKIMLDEFGRFTLPTYAKIHGVISFKGCETQSKWSRLLKTGQHGWLLTIVEVKQR